MKKLLAILLLVAFPAQAAPWNVHRENGAIAWAGQYAQPGYADEVLDDSSSTELQAFLAPPKPTLINPGDFLARFTPTEQGCVQQAAITNAQIALGLTMGLARGAIDLKGPLLAPWMAALVSAGCLTSQRATAIMTP